MACINGKWKITRVPHNSVYIYIYIFQFPNIVYIYLKDLLDLLQIYLEYLSMMTPGPAYFLSQSLQYAAPTGIYKPCK